MWGGSPTMARHPTEAKGAHVTGREMRAGVFTALNQMELRRLPVPAVPPGGLLLRVSACGTCGTDLRIFQHGDARVPFGQILGHEIVGTAVEIAPGVRGFSAGDTVVVAPPKAPCGVCRFCKRGETNLCPNGRSFGYALPGGFAEYVAIPEEAMRAGVVHRVPGDSNAQVLALTEPVACAIRGQRKVGLTAGDRVVVIGAGPVGVIHCRLAKLAGASLVISSERRASRRAHARGSADHVVDPSKENLGKVVQEMTNGEGADVVIVACSSRDAQIEALTLVGRGGRINFFGGLPHGDAPLPIDTNVLHYREVMLTGTHGSTPAENVESLALLTSGKLQVADLITNVLPLEELRKAFESGDVDGVMKTVVRP